MHRKLNFKKIQKCNILVNKKKSKRHKKYLKNLFVYAILNLSKKSFLRRIKMKNKTKILIVALIVALLALAVGYAAFSQRLTVTGKADASGKFEVVFTGGSIHTPDHGSVSVNQEDNTKMTVSVKLSYPGDGCTVTANIQNKGTVPAKLTGFHLYNKGATTAFSNKDIEVLIQDSAADEVLDVGDSVTKSFNVKWK